MSSFGGQGWSVEIQDQRAYLAQGYNLTILDVQDPANVVPLARLPIPFVPYDLAVDATRVVLTGGELTARCAAIDVTEPAAPRIENVFDLPQTIFDVALSGNTACLAYGHQGVQLVDLSDPTQPVLGGFLNTDGQPFEIDMQGDLVFVADSFQSALLILDASNPATLSVEGTLDLENGSSPSHVRVDGNKMYLVTYGSDLQIADISNPALPQAEGSTPLGGTNTKGLAISGNKALITDGGPSPFFSLVDVSNPAAPVVSATYSFGSDPGEVAMSGDLAAIIVTPDDDRLEGNFFWNGVAFYDLQTGKGVAPLKPYLVPYAPTFAKAIGNLLYVADGVTYSQWILHLMDISDPRFPLTVGTHKLPEEPYEIQLKEDLLYVDVYESGFQVLDVSDPTSPQLLNQIDTPGRANDLELDQNRIYIADGDTGVSVYDAVNPITPTLVGTWPGGPYEDYAEVIIPVGNLVYVADGAGLHILNVSNPASITVVGSEPSFPRVSDMAYANGLVYGGLYLGGLQILDVSVPAAPVPRGFWEGPSSAYTSSLFLLSNRAFLGTYGYGLQIVDVSSPDSPVSCGSVSRSEEFVYVTLAGDYVYISGALWGVQALSLGCQNTPDVNRDGAVDVQDLLLIHRAFLSPPTIPQPEDVNCDGILDRDDVLEFAPAWKILAGNR